MYEDVNDYEDVEIYETVMDYQTVIRDVFEKRTETIEHFSASVATIQTGLIWKYRKSIDEGIEKAKEYAGEQIESIKEQFMASFDKLDQQILAKYEELDSCARSLEKKEEELENNRKILSWIETNIQELDSVLEI